MSEPQNASGVIVNEPQDGWLHRTINKGRRQLIMMFKPMDLVQRGSKVTIPCEPQEAHDLFEDLNAHFFAWTGKSLRDFIRTEKLDH